MKCPDDGHTPVGDVSRRALMRTMGRGAVVAGTGAWIAPRISRHAVVRAAPGSPPPQTTTTTTAPVRPGHATTTSTTTTTTAPVRPGHATTTTATSTTTTSPTTTGGRLTGETTTTRAAGGVGATPPSAAQVLGTSTSRTPGASALSFTGADVEKMLEGAAAALGLGGAALLASQRRHRSQDESVVDAEDPAP